MKHIMYLKTTYLNKIVVSSIVFLQVIFSFASPTPARADLFDIGNLGGSSGSLGPGSFGSGSFGSGSMSGVIDDIEKRYHINPSSVANLGETMNVSPNKEMVPQINLFFDPTDPKNGKEITAQAFPLYFSSQKESLYFTWYLKRKGCDLKSGSLSVDEKLCDLDNNGSITINDWKVNAMRRIANGGFAGDQVNYTQNSNDDDGYTAQFGGDTSKSTHCYIHDFSSGEDYELNSNGSNKCAHLFPKSNVNATGNGSFGKDEEKFWHTDPQDPSTTQNGNKDEANVVGLGQDKFTWNYASGDEIGVVIEGLSMNATKYRDASMKVMWAFSKNKCTPIPTGQTLDGAAYNGGVSKIPTANTDLNDCLKDNLVDPTQGNQAGKLEITLSSVPENPIIDSFSEIKSDNRGDLLTIQSLAVNSAVKDANVSYDWRVYANSNKSQTDDSAWEDITKGLVAAHAVSGVIGNDLSALKINLNLNDQTKANNQLFFERYFGNDAVGYFRVNLTATENFDVGKKRVGRSSVILKIMRAQAQIQTHAVDVDTNFKLKFVTPAGGDTGMLCEESMSDRTICPVVRGQIIGLSFDANKVGFPLGSGSDISWMINNKPLHCSVSVSEDPDCVSGIKNFFPVTGDIGEMYTVTMMANNPLTGKSITLTRVFSVTNPSLTIISADSSKVWPKYLGQYVDSNGDTVDNYSKETFEAYSGGSFILKGLFYPNSLKSGINASWFVNDVSVVPDGQGLVTIDTTQSTTLVDAVSLDGIYTPSPKIKKALFDIWGISVADMTETRLSSNIQIEIVPNSGGLATDHLNSSKKFFASIISYVPTSVIFFFRLVVTVGLILFTVGIVFSFVPEKRKM